MVVVCLACFYCNDLYDLTSGGGPVDRALRVPVSHVSGIVAANVTLAKNAASGSRFATHS